MTPIPLWEPGIPASESGIGVRSQNGRVPAPIK